MHCDLLGTIDMREYGGRVPKPTGDQAQHASANADVEEKRDKSKGHKALSIFKSQHWSSTNTEENGWEQLESLISLDYSWFSTSACLRVIWALSWSRVRAGVEGRDAEEGELCIVGRGQVLKKTVDEGR